MFFARQEAPDPARSALRSLRPSLNTPVVVVEDLPAGPASAAIACFGDPAGPHVVLAIRSERSGQAIFFGPDAERRDAQRSEPAVDAALSFAESMGFLFDEDRLAQAPAEAQRAWLELIDACSRSSPAAPPAAEVAPEALPSPAPFEADGEEIRQREIAPAAQAVGASHTLTKFRRAPAPGRPARTGRQPSRPLGHFRVGLQRRSS